MQLRVLRGAPAALAGQQFITVAQRPNHDRLDHAGLTDRVSKFGDALRIKAAPRLVGARADQIDGELANRSVQGSP